MKIIILGLSITSFYGNGHATTYRGLVRELSARGHDVLFLERNVPWHAVNRDVPKPSYGRTELYSSLKELKHRFADDIRDADLVIIGSSVTESATIGEWLTHIAEGVTAFYDFDTPETLAHLNNGGSQNISKELIRRYQIYLSFSGGPILDQFEDKFGSPMARPLYSSVDPQLYFPEERPHKWDLGYMETYSSGRQRALDRLLLESARHWRAGRFTVAGSQYPEEVNWPGNVQRIEHIAPAKHRAFYTSQRFTLNITRANMIAAGYSPGVHLFEAAACGTPIISDHWAGMDQFFKPDEEILISDSADQTLIYLEDIPEHQRRRIGERARARVLARHTARHRAIELENYALELLKLTCAHTDALPDDQRQ